MGLNPIEYLKNRDPWWGPLKNKSYNELEGNDSWKNKYKNLFHGWDLFCKSHPIGKINYHSDEWSFYQISRWRNDILIVVEITFLAQALNPEQNDWFVIIVYFYWKHRKHRVHQEKAVSTHFGGVEGERRIRYLFPKENIGNHFYSIGAWIQLLGVQTQTRADLQKNRKI